MFYKISDYSLVSYSKSHVKNKKYDAILKSKSNGKLVRVPFGDLRYTNYRDCTKLNLYPHLINNNTEKRRLYRLRHKKDLREEFYSPGYFSLHILW